MKKLDDLFDLDSNKIGVPDLPPCTKVKDGVDDSVEVEREEGDEEVNQYLEKVSERINNPLFLVFSFRLRD